MTGQFSAGGGDLGAWCEPVLETIRAADPASPGAGSGVIERDCPPSMAPCVACDGDDPCLPRWEDDGGGMGPIEIAGQPPDGSPRPATRSQPLEEAPG